ncbi:MAG: AAA family ATPase [Bacilli bacterium]|nr:AAA family ATPase [Bacilli bacterium]MDD4406616.1 AAA family ATPase [Bacilli bacterium]
MLIIKEDIPVLLLKKLSLLPLQEVRIELNNDLSKKIIDLSIKKYNKKILIILPINSLEESPSVKDLPEVGVLTYIKSSIELPNGNYRVVIKGLNRVKTLNYTNYKENKSILISTIKKLYIDKGETNEEVALKRKLIELTRNYIKINPESSNSILTKINENESLDNLTDLVVPFINLPLNKKIKYMNEFSEALRSRNLIEDLTIELEVIKLNNKLDRDIRIDFEREQKEYLLKAKVEKLNQELGINSSTKESEILLYTEKIKLLNVNESINEKLVHELKKYNYTPENSPDASIIRNYLDTVLSLPFNISSKEELNVLNINNSLNKTHYGVEHIKRRIEEYAALKAINPELISPIICLVGAPGVGKTTLAMSISGALKREFFKISVGGLNDSSELIGHRRTYLGASPGKIISGIKKCGVDNPVILIDEVDKMVKDYKGDPASVLLDILDVNQNKNFIDNYIEEPFDLSAILFILTANDENMIPVPLKDRLEIMYIDSYTIYDKKDIALNHLIPNICLKYNYKKIKIKDEYILFIINHYTLESGVRELERILDKLIRNIIINNITSSKITLDYIKKILGNIIYDNIISNNDIGTINILGVSPLGGKIINVQSLLIPNEAGITITGNVGDITKDNIYVVINYLKATRYIDSKILNNKSFHINFNQDIKLNGASGSLGVAVSILSLINNIKIDSKIAFTGKLDLYGNILKVKSIKEKIITAFNNNIKTIYLPQLNLEDINKVPVFILKEMKLIFVSTFDELYKDLFKKAKTSK